jgi:hypothetical protein
VENFSRGNAVLYGKGIKMMSGIQTKEAILIMARNWTSYIGIMLPKSVHENAFPQVKTFFSNSDHEHEALKRIAEADLSVYSAEELQEIAREAINE